MASPVQHPTATTMDNLPCEVLSEILIRVPAKPLAQMRSVSKPWNALLSKPSFIKSHLHRSLHNNNNNNNDEEILLVLADGSTNEPFSVTAIFSRSPHLAVINFIKPPVISPSESETVKFLGSVNGLICFSFRSDNHLSSQIPSYSYDLVIKIWNPSLSSVLTLPPCQLPYSNFDPIKMYFRFGYDPKTDDYKLVKLMRLVKEWKQVEVYSLRKDSWGFITQSFPSHITEISNEDKVCVDGCDGFLHWVGYIDMGRKLQSIVVFDLGMETFSEISLPQSVIDSNGHRRPSLGVMAGKLGLMSLNHYKKLECEMWVMNEYGVGGSWVKHHVLSHLTGAYHLYGFTLSNKFVFGTLDRRFFLYDPVSSGIGTLISSRFQRLKIVRYVESLVWIEPVGIS